MHLSVVIPVYNSERTIGPLVERLQTCLRERAFEVVLVNDGSADASAGGTSHGQLGGHVWVGAAPSPSWHCFITSLPKPEISINLVQCCN